MFALLPLHGVRGVSTQQGVEVTTRSVTCRSVGVACGAVWNASRDVSIAWRVEGLACSGVWMRGLPAGAWPTSPAGLKGLPWGRWLFAAGLKG